MNGHEIAETIKEYKPLSLLLDCEEYELAEWQRIHEQNKAIEAYHAEYHRKLEELGIKPGKSHDFGLLKTSKEMIDHCQERRDRLRDRMMSAENAILDLSDKDAKQIMWLRFIDDMSVKQISEVLKLPTGHIYQTIKDTLNVFRDQTRE